MNKKIIKTEVIFPFPKTGMDEKLLVKKSKEFSDAAEELAKNIAAQMKEEKLSARVKEDENTFSM